MWKNISELLSAIFVFNEKFTHQDKRIDECERHLRDLSTRVTQMSIDLARLVEREQAKELLFKQALENERLRLELEQLKQQQRALPPADKTAPQS